MATDTELQNFVEDGDFDLLILVDVSGSRDRELGKLCLLEVHANDQENIGRRRLQMAHLTQQFPGQDFDLCTMTVDQFFDDNAMTSKQLRFKRDALNGGHVLIGGQDRALIVNELQPHRSRR